MNIKGLQVILIFGLLLLVSCTNYQLIVVGGSGSGEYKKGENIEILANVAPNGYKFYRWDGDYSYVADRFSSRTRVLIDKETISLKAVFVSKYETYSLVVNDGEGGGQYVPGDKVRIVSHIPEHPKEFYIWNTNYNLFDLGLKIEQLKNKKIDFIMPQEDLTISAKFDILFFVSIINGSGTGKYPEGYKLSINAFPSENGYVFDHWMGNTTNLQDQTKMNTILTVPNEDIYLEASYRLEPKYKLSIINGSGSGDYKEGTTVRITALAPTDGLEFVEWSGDTNVISDITHKTHFFKMPNRDTSLEAIFQQAPDFKVTVIRGSGEGRYEAGSNVNIEANAALSGYHFVSWKGDVSLLDDPNESITTFTMPENDVSFEADYKKDDPLPTPTPTPDPNEIPEKEGYNSHIALEYAGAIVMIDGIIQRRFIFQGLGPDYGSSVLLVFNDGIDLHVPNTQHFHIGHNAVKFQPGGRYSSNNPDIPTMEVYAARGSNASRVILYYNK